MTRVYLVRHATHDRVGKALVGRMAGVDLSAEGLAQAEATGRHLAGHAVGAILSSPLERCRQTAAAIASVTGVAAVSDDALIELDYGDWTGRTFDDLRDDPRWHAWNATRTQATVPGGEGIEDVRGRVMALIDRLGAGANPPTVLVTHGDVIKVVVLTLLGATLDRHDRLEIDPASITTLDLWPGAGKIVRANEAAA